MTRLPLQASKPSNCPGLQPTTAALPTLQKQLSTGKEQSCQGLLLMEEVPEMVATAIQWVVESNNMCKAEVVPLKGHCAVVHILLLGARRLGAKLPFKRSTSKLRPYFVFKHQGSKARSEVRARAGATGGSACLWLAGLQCV